MHNGHTLQLNNNTTFFVNQNKYLEKNLTENWYLFIYIKEIRFKCKKIPLSHCSHQLGNRRHDRKWTILWLDQSLTIAAKDIAKLMHINIWRYCLIDSSQYVEILNNSFILFPFNRQKLISFCDAQFLLRS